MDRHILDNMIIDQHSHMFNSINNIYNGQVYLLSRMILLFGANRFHMDAVRTTYGESN